MNITAPIKAQYQAGDMICHATRGMCVVVSCVKQGAIIQVLASGSCVHVDRWNLAAHTRLAILTPRCPQVEYQAD